MNAAESETNYVQRLAWYKTQFYRVGITGGEWGKIFANAQDLSRSTGQSLWYYLRLSYEQMNDDSPNVHDQFAGILRLMSKSVKRLPRKLKKKIKKATT